MKNRKTPLKVVLRNKLSEWKRRINSSSRMLPSFVIIGTARGGTTSLFNYLSLHPNIKMPVKKEIAYFCTHYAKGIGWYRSHFPFQKESSIITGEASPYYLSHPRAPERFKSQLPDAKIIVLLRNPVERSFSSYKNIKKIGLETAEDFETAVALEASRTLHEEQKLLDDNHYYSSKHQHFSYLKRSIYYKELENWFLHFPEDQFLIISSESFYSDPAGTYREVVQFLGLPAHDPGPLKPFNESAKGEQISPDFRKKLTDFFSPHNEKLFQLIKRRFDWT